MELETMSPRFYSPTQVYEPDITSLIPVVNFGAYLSLLESCNYFISIITCLLKIDTATNKRWTANRKDETHNSYLYPLTHIP